MIVLGPQHLGEQRGQWVYNAVRGICSEPVVAKGPPKSMLAAKSFNATSDVPALQRQVAPFRIQTQPNMIHASGLQHAG
eukprot:scaffold280759_cov39-Prasinocladus_malaysianus.AAC.2